MILISGIILAGGESKRMKTDKAFIPFKGKMLIEHTINLFSKSLDEILISANSENYSVFGYPVIKDEIPECGPIAGIYSSLKKAKNDWSLVAGCDTPFLSGKLVKRLFESVGYYDCIVPLHYSKKEPLVALYHKNSIPYFEKNINNRIYKMHVLLEKLNCRYVDVSDLLEDNPIMFSNFNSPSDIADFTDR